MDITTYKPDGAFIYFPTDVTEPMQFIIPDITWLAIKTTGLTSFFHYQLFALMIVQGVSKTVYNLF